MKVKVISLKFVSESNEPVGYLMVKTDDKKFAKQTACEWGKSKLETPFTIVEIHQGVMDSPNTDSEIFKGVKLMKTYMEQNQTISSNITIPR